MELEPTKGTADQELPVKKAVNLPEGLTADYVVKQSAKWNSSFLSYIRQELDKIKLFRRVSRSINDDRKSQENVVIPLAENIVTTIVAKMLRAVFPSLRIVDALVDEDLDEDELEEPNIVEDFVNQKLSESSRGKAQADDFFKNAVVDGTCFGYAFWDKRSIKTTEPIFMQDPLAGVDVEVGSRPTTKTKGCASWESVSIDKMAWDPGHGNDPIEEVAWIRRRHQMSMNEMLRWEKQGLFSGVTEIYEKGIKPGGRQDDQDSSANDVGDPQATQDNAPAYQVDEFWADLPYKDKDGKIVTHAARWFILEKTYLIKFGANPYTEKLKPFVMFRYSLRPSETLGTSVIEPIYSLLLNVMANVGKLADLIKKAANTPLLIGSGFGANTRNLYMAQNGLIPVENPREAVPLPINAAAIASTQNAIVADINMIRESTPANEQAQGISSGGGTATEARILQLGSGVKFEHLQRRAGIEFIAPLATWYYRLYRQFGKDGDMWVRQGSREGRPIPVTREMLHRDYTFEPISVESENDKNLRIAQVQKALDSMIQMSSITGQPLDTAYKFMVEQMFPLIGVHNGKDFQPEANQMQAEAQGQPQLPGGATPTPQAQPAIGPAGV